MPGGVEQPQNCEDVKEPNPGLHDEAALAYRPVPPVPQTPKTEAPRGPSEPKPVDRHPDRGPSLRRMLGYVHSVQSLLWNTVIGELKQPPRSGCVL